MGDETLRLEVADGDVAVVAELDAAMNFALAHNGISPLKRVSIANHGLEDLGNLQFELAFASTPVGKVAEPLQSTLPFVESGETRELDARAVRWAFDAATFAGLDEATTATLEMRVFDRHRALVDRATMRLLAHDEWWALTIHESLAAFVTPRARAVQDLVGDASDLLQARTGDPSVQGYQGGADRARAIAEAIYDAMRARQIRYINPPASFEGTGQKIRSAHEVLVDRWGTCLDLAVTHAAALEHAGLHPVIVLCRGHAFSGHLFEDLQLPELVLRDPYAIRNYVDSGLLLPVETTAICATERTYSYAEAIRRTHEGGWWADGIADVEGLIDVSAAHRAVRPLPSVTLQDGVRVVEVERGGSSTAALPVAAPSAAAATERSRGAARPSATFPPRVERWRNALLDLRFSNPLLNMRSGASSLDVHVPTGSLGALEDLMFEGHALALAPHDELAEIHVARGARTAQDIDPETLAGMLVKDKILFAACTEARYLTRMRGLQRKARTVVEETGANNLFLTLGSLQWEDAGRSARAPLFLLPVTIEAHRGRHYTLHIDDGASAQPNQCLLEKLRLAHGLAIPQFSQPEQDDAGIDLGGSLQAIRRALIDAGLSFSVDESATISLLQFSTLQLWQDLSEHWETFLRNPVVRHLVETPTDSFEANVGEVLPTSEAEATAFCPISIDGSQLEAITWAQAGRSFVIEGPPGTGKSQTITNLIANALAQGQKVLFVAEKQAALDVVRRRLDAVGLGDLCLDLHGKDQTPQNVRKQLATALQLQTTTNAQAWASARAGHRTSVESLNRYPAALHEVGGAGLSAWSARQAVLSAGDGTALTLAPEVVINPLDSDAVYDAARNLTHAVYDLGTAVAAHPWRLARLRDVADTARRDEIRTGVHALADAATAADGDPIIEMLSSVPGGDAVDAAEAWLAASGSQAFTDVAIADLATTPGWKERGKAARDALSAARSTAASSLTTFEIGVTEAPLDDLLARSRAADGKLFKGKPRKAVADDLAAFARDSAAIDPKTMTATLETLVTVRSQSQAAADAVRAVDGVALGESWHPLADDAEKELEEQTAAVEATAAFLQRCPEAREPLRRLGTEVPASVVPALTFCRAWGGLARAIDASDDSIDAWRGDRPVVDAIAATLAAWRADATAGDLRQLGRWVEVQRHLGFLRDVGMTGLDDLVLAGAIGPDDIESALRRSIARAALEERMSTAVLTGFDGVSRDRQIERFAASSDEMRSDMVAELPHQIIAARPFDPEHMVGNVGQLSRELTRKRGGLKIRELFTNFGPVIADLTPCLMMSPHSVARFLPPDAVDIDLVVFDEASQIRVAEAISAMGRAKATVVVGDSQQMPPSNTMATTTLDEYDEFARAAGIPSDMESVLSEAVESKLPRLWLSWHYRSRHEALISFSNHRYYEGRLASFPRPPKDHPGLGVSLRRVQGSFERGGARVNRVEADAIVAEIRARVARDATASIGVVTFNVQQRDLITDLLEESGDAAVAEALSAETDPLFVKNLENVQGDERDVILFSLAFSPDPKTGRLWLFFGPLSHAGGERRLNVAVTRARAEVILFASFDPSHIDLSRTSSVGLEHLRGYMEMAQRHDDAPLRLRPPTARDLHVEEVVGELERAGFIVRRSIGLSDFQIDVAVAESEDGPWVAVFLDGEDYRTRKTVGDREVLPQVVLVGSMGWTRVVRVWLPDWIRDRNEVIGRIRTAVAAEPVSAPARAPEPVVAARADLVAAVASQVQPTAAPPVEVVLPVRSAVADVAAQPAPVGGRDAVMFVAADEEIIGTREDLDDTSGQARRRVAHEAEAVLLHESPISTTRLARIVCRRFGLQRMAASRAASVVGILPAGRIESTPFGDFAWAAGMEPSSYAEFRRTTGEPVRSLDEIAPQELINGMRHLATIGGGIDREELVRETAALFGYRRVAAKARAHVEAVLEHGVSVGRLSANGVTITAAV